MQNSRRNARTWPYPRHKAFEELLRKSNAEWFSKQGYAVNQKMPYILTQWEDWPKNIILPEVVDYIRSEKDDRASLGVGFPLHKYIHHGLSSQAMLFNLVGPLVVTDNYSPLKKAFTEHGVAWPSGDVTLQFEVEDRTIFNEDSGQPTSIDLVIQGIRGEVSLFVESKLVEHEFGGCSVFAAGDCDGKNPVDEFSRCYLHHLGRQYWVLLKKHGFFEGLIGTSPICPLAMYYQYFREVLFAIESGGDFVLLYDERNPTFYCGNGNSDRGLMPFLSAFLPDDLKSRIHAISIQDIIHSFEKDNRFIWINDFKNRYAIE